MGGFALPFVVVGAAGIVVAFALLILVPDLRAQTDASEDGGNGCRGQPSFKMLLQVLG